MVGQAAILYYSKRSVAQNTIFLRESDDFCKNRFRRYSNSVNGKYVLDKIFCHSDVRSVGLVEGRLSRFKVFLCPSFVKSDNRCGKF